MAFDTRLTGPLTVTVSPNDEGHLAVAFGVSVGRFAGLFGSYALVGFDSGGGIRTRDLRVMSPTSYQTAPPRGGPFIVAPRRSRRGFWLVSRGDGPEKGALGAGAFAEMRKPDCLSRPGVFAS
jgi:hypothetical protein